MLTTRSRHAHTNSEAREGSCSEAGHVQVGGPLDVLAEQVGRHLHDETVLTHAPVCPVGTSMAAEVSDGGSSARAAPAL